MNDDFPCCAILHFLLTCVFHLLCLAFPEVWPCVLVTAAAAVIAGMVRSGIGLVDAVLRLGGRAHLCRGGR